MEMLPGACPIDVAHLPELYFYRRHYSFFPFDQVFSRESVQESYVELFHVAISGHGQDDIALG